MSETTGGTLARRSHPATPLIRAWLWLLAALAWSVRSIIEDGSSYSVAGIVVGGAVVGGLGVGYLMWAFTYFVIDGTELRIDSGILFKQSRRMPYERIQSVDIAQPLGARIFGLAELRIEMAGGEQSRTRVQFLPLAEARALRGTLLDRSSRADGETIDDAEQGTEQSAEHGAEPVVAKRRTITEVPTGRLIAALLISTDFFAIAVLLCATLIGLWLSATAVLFAGAEALVASAVPILLATGGWIFALTRSRVFELWGFRVSYGTDGLRVDRGLFNRISQSIPLDRVQGIVIEQRLAWRLFGWYRLRVDTAGYTRGEEVSDEESTSVLLPVGKIDAVREVFANVLPGVDPMSVPTRVAPRRSAVFAPIGWRFRSIGYDERVAVLTRGWVTHRIDVVPHAKTQSVRVLQGPLQRMLGLTDMVFDTTKGPVQAHAQSRDEAEVRALALSQLDRARAARRTPTDDS